jgi:hypothetical protein
MMYTAQKTLVFEDFLTQHGDNSRYELANRALSLTVEQILEA